MFNVFPVQGPPVRDTPWHVLPLHEPSYALRASEGRPAIVLVLVLVLVIVIVIEFSRVHGHQARATPCTSPLSMNLPHCRVPICDFRLSVER